jgi:hypothetical protein
MATQFAREIEQIKGGLEEVEVEGGKVVAFYGNHSKGYDRLPPDEWSRGGNPGWPEFRSDCPYALSPYWDGFVVCIVGHDADFSQHPPGFGARFKVLEWIDTPFPLIG